MQKGARAVFKADGSVGRVVEVLNGGFFVVFATNAGARFTVRADELVAYDGTKAQEIVTAQAARVAGLAASCEDQRRPYTFDSGRIVARVDIPPRVSKARMRTPGDFVLRFAEAAA